MWSMNLNQKKNVTVCVLVKYAVSYGIKVKEIGILLKLDQSEIA